MFRPTSVQMFSAQEPRDGDTRLTMEMLKQTSIFKTRGDVKSGELIASIVVSIKDELSTDAKCSDKNKRQSSSYEYDWIHEDDAVYQHLVTVSGKVWAPLVSSGQSAGKSSQQFRNLTNLQFSFKMRCAVLKHPNKPTDVGFPRPQTVSRHHLSGKRRSELLQETFHICFLGFYEQQARKRETVLTDTPETLWQSSPQLFHFAHFLRGLRGWHQVAHYYLFQSLSHRLWQRAGCGASSGEGGGGGGPVLRQPCGASSAQLQRAGKHRKRSLSGSHCSHQLVRTNAFLRLTQECGSISTRGTKSPRWSIQSGKRA